MLVAHHLRKAYGLEPILEDVSLSLNAGDRTGLVGPNGSGKTTLLRILAGVERPDGGSVHLTPANLRVGYLPQGLQFQPDDTVSGFMGSAAGDPDALAAEVERLASALAQAPDQPDLQQAYDNALARLATQAADPGRVAETLAGLGLGEVPSDLPVAALSGGQKTRLALASVLVGDPQLLLLDEPTNHLDLDMLEWLEDWLNAYAGGVLVVSHDRAFLDRTVNSILELDPARRQVRQYAGNYTDYLEQKLAERERDWQAYADQQEEIQRLRAAARHLRGLARMRKGGKADDGDKFARGFFGNRSAGMVGRAKHVEARLERLQNEERIEKPRQGWQMKLDFGAVPASGQEVLVLEDLAVGYGDRVLLRGLNLRVRHGARVALIGANGSGKTTLLRTIAGQIPPLAGRVRLGANVRLGYMAQEQELLDPALDALTTIAQVAPLSHTEIRSFLHYFLFAGDDVFVPVGSLSFGERARLALARLVAQGCNFLLLDEPINHLDIPSRARFEQALAGFEGTALAVVHDRYFLDRFASEVWEVEGQGLRVEVEAI